MTIAMTPTRLFKWIGGIVLALVALAVLVVAVVGWNWLRGPIERAALEKTGRALTIVATSAWHSPGRSHTCMLAR